LKTSDLAAIFLAVIAATLLIHGFIRDSWQILVVGVFAAIGAAWALIEPEMNRRGSASEKKTSEKTASESPDTKPDNPILQSNQIELFPPGQSNQAQRALELELKSSRETAADLKKEVANWQKTSIDFVDYLDSLLKLDSLDDKCASAFSKARTELIKKMSDRGIIEIRPKPGDPFDDRLHSSDNSPDTESDTPLFIQSVDKSGFSIGARVIRPAKVRLVQH
jgi:molecular chaperone GrpE (heat shock protein)